MLFLYDIQIIHQYENLLNSKFKTSLQLNECETLKSKITNITAPIEKVDFDVYLEIFRDEWQEVLDMFEESVTEIDQRLKLLTIKAFSKTKYVFKLLEIFFLLKWHYSEFLKKLME